MKHILVLLFVVSVGQFAFAQSSACGKAVGFAYNQDTYERPYRLSGFWVKQSTTDIRITYGNSPELIDAVEGLEGSIFVCLDEYETKIKPYAGKPRTYGIVTQFRIWLDGEEI